jgi:AraC-like DNA-binding protein
MSSRTFCNLEPYQTGLRSTEALTGSTSGISERPDSISDDGRRAGLSAEADRILDDVRRAMQESPQGARAAALRLVALLSLPEETDLACARGGLAPWQKRKVDRFLKEHLERPVHLSELAEQVLLSVSHFCRAFKETFGETPHAYIVGLRLELARALMLATEDPLSQIALACGLSDQAHLSKLFRRVMGETPNAWRRRNLTDNQAEVRCSRSKTHSTFRSLGRADRAA